MALKNVYETEKGRPIEKIPIIAWAITEIHSSDGDKRLFPTPIEAFSTVPSTIPTERSEDSNIVEIVKAKPESYLIMVWDENGDPHELGYELPGATHPAWDDVIDRKEIAVNTEYDYETVE